MELKEEALDRTVRRTRFVRGYGALIRQTTERMNQVYISLAECNGGTTQSCPCALDTTTKLQHLLAETYLTRYRQSAIALILLCSIVVLTPDGQFLGCATTEFSERYNLTTKH